ncbi:MAG: hypothetical protein ACYCW6_31815, partial [Candidatus Xenobia bacterium]
MFRKLSWQLTTTFFVVILLSMALLGFYLVSRLDDVFSQDLEYSLHNEAELVSTVVSQYVESNAGPDQADLKNPKANPADPLTQQQKRIVYQLSTVVNTEYGSRIRVLKADGTVYIDTGGEAGVSLKLPEIVAAMHGEEKATTLEPDSDNEPAEAALAYPVRVWKPARGGSRFAIAGVVYVTRSLDFLSKLLHDVRNDFVVGTVISLFVTGLF